MLRIAGEERPIMIRKPDPGCCLNRKEDCWVKALLVIDMQEDYIGATRDKRRFPYHPERLIPKVNERIQNFKNEGNLVVYILNRFFYQNKKYVPHLVEGLSVVSDHIFIKNRMNCFSNPALTCFLLENHIAELELVGIDGNYCMAASARGGVKNKFSVLFNQRCIEAAKGDKFGKTIRRLRASDVMVQE